MSIKYYLIMLNYNVKDIGIFIDSSKNQHFRFLFQLQYFIFRVSTVLFNSHSNTELYNSNIIIFEIVYTNIR